MSDKVSPIPFFAKPMPSWSLFFEYMFPLYLFISITLVGIKKHRMNTYKSEFKSSKQLVTENNQPALRR